MEIEYELTLDDHIAFNLYHARHSPTMRRNYLINYLSPVIVFLILSLYMLFDIKMNSHAYSAIWIPMILMMLVLLWLYWVPRYYVKALKTHVKKINSEGKNKDKTTFGKVKLTFEPTEIKIVGENSEAKANWKAIEKITPTEQHVFMFTAPNFALIIPKRAFPDEAKCREFIETAKKYHADAACEK